VFREGLSSGYPDLIIIHIVKVYIVLTFLPYNCVACVQILYGVTKKIGCINVT